MRRLFLLLCFVFCGSSSAEAASAPDRALIASGGNPLKLAERERAALPIDDYAQRVARLDLRVSSSTGSNGRFALPGVGEWIEIEPFPGERLGAVGREVREGLGGIRTWIGEIDDGSDGLIVLSHDGRGGIYGTIEQRQNRYLISRGRDGKMYIADVDTEMLPPEAEPDYDPLEPVARQKAAATTSAATASQSTVVIDLMVVYTSRVAQRVDVGLLANNGVAELNTAMQYAGIDVAINLRALEHVEYSESNDFDQMVSDLIAGAGGLNAAHAFRDYHGADLVVMLVDGSIATSLCGGAASPTRNQGPSARANSSAWAAVADNCHATSYTFAHEVGHLLGARHDRSSGTNVSDAEALCPPGTPSTVQCSYGRGYVTVPPPQFPDKKYRTIMAGGSGCTRGWCPRILRWSDSNPAHTYDGLSLGIAAGSASSADNARIIAEVAHIMAGYREAVPVPPPGAPYPFRTTHICDGRWRAEWAASPGADYYQMYLKKTTSSTWMRAYEGPGLTTQFTVTTGTDAVVRACNSAGCSGLLSSGWTAYVFTPPACP